jgi:hypothetical protein
MAAARRLKVRSRLWRSPLPTGLAGGLVGAQLVLALAPDGGAGAALEAGAKAAIGCWAVLMLAEVGVSLLRGRTADSVAGAWPEPAASATPTTALHIALAGAGLIAAALQRTPSRLVLNLLVFAFVALPLWWVVQRRAGAPAAAKAAAILAVFAFYPTHLDLRQAPVTEQWRADSPFRWSVGWPSEEWVLRHEIQLRGREEPRAGRPMRLTFLTAGPGNGPGQVFVTVNGQDLGPHRATRDRTLPIDVPADLLAGRARLVVDLRQSPLDPSLRILAQRWAGGATMGAQASSFYDTRGWWPGTFNDLAGRQQPGMYLAPAGGAGPCAGGPVCRAGRPGRRARPGAAGQRTLVPGLRALWGDPAGRVASILGIELLPGALSQLS